MVRRVLPLKKSSSDIELMNESTFSTGVLDSIIDMKKAKSEMKQEIKILQKRTDLVKKEKDKQLIMKDITKLKDKLTKLDSYILEKSKLSSCKASEI